MLSFSFGLKIHASLCSPHVYHFLMVNGGIDQSVCMANVLLYTHQYNSICVCVCGGGVGNEATKNSCEVIQCPLPHLLSPFIS